MARINRLLSLLMLCLFLSNPVLALELTDKLQLNIAERLANDEEYYRSITEFKKLHILFPESPLREEAYIKEGIAHYVAGDHANIFKPLNRLRKLFPESQLIASSFFLEGLSFYENKKYEASKTNLDIVTDIFPDSRLAPQAIAAKSLIYFDTEDYGKSKESLSHLANSFPDYHTTLISNSQRIIESTLNLPRKSKAIAGTLSAFLPGAGYLYAGDKGDAMSAFALNALFLGGSIVSFNQNNIAAGIALATVGLPFYIGNIYGSANAAHKANLTLRNGHKNELIAQLNFVFQLD